MKVGRIAVIGEGLVVRAYALAGAEVAEADHPDSVIAAWNALPGDVVLAVLTRKAADALAGAGPGREQEGADRLVVVIDG